MFQIILSIISLVGVAIETLGISSGTVRAWMSLLKEFLTNGEATVRDLKALEAQIKQMVAEGRNPTNEEWVSLTRRSDRAHDTIQNS